MNDAFEQWEADQASGHLPRAFPYNMGQVGGQAAQTPPDDPQTHLRAYQRAIYDEPPFTPEELQAHTARLTNAQLDEFYQRLIQASTFTSNAPWTGWHEPYSNLDAVEERASAARSPREKGTMNLIKGNMWEQQGYDAICITTNGFVTKTGKAVMGRGCALEAAKRWPELPRRLGGAIQSHANRCMPIEYTKHLGEYTFLVAFPTKASSGLFDGKNTVAHMKSKFEVGQTVPGWALKSDLYIITRSAHELVQVANSHGWEKILLPRPGVAAGELKWEEVKAALDPILDDRFHIITN